VHEQADDPVWLPPPVGDAKEARDEV
jgi:hypothetical protein